MTEYKRKRARKDEHNKNNPCNCHMFQISSIDKLAGYIGQGRPPMNPNSIRNVFVFSYKITNILSTNISFSRRSSR